MNRKNNNILVITDGSWDHASSRTRALLYFNYFKLQLNLSIKWIPRIPQKKQTGLYKWFIFPLLKRFLFCKLFFYILLFQFDVVFVQRYFLSAFLLRILKKKRSKIIYDFDDAIYLDKPGEHKNTDKTTRMVNAADQIIISSAELAPFCRSSGNEKIEIITTPVEPEKFKIHTPHLNQPIVIGWIGSSYTTPYLKLIESALQEIKRNFDIKLLLIGADPTYRIAGVPIEVVSWNLAKEAEHMDMMDIGIMPLTSDGYSKGKGGYKLFQYMAAGIPVVASPVGINSEIVIENQNGFLAERSEDWIKSVTYLIENSAERERMGKIGRRYVEEKYSREVNFKLLYKIIKSI